MDNLLTRARAGRVNAIERRASGSCNRQSTPNIDLRFKTSDRIDPIPFISSRAQACTVSPQSHVSGWVH